MYTNTRMKLLNSAKYVTHGSARTLHTTTHKQHVITSCAELRTLGSARGRTREVSKNGAIQGAMKNAGVENGGPNSTAGETTGSGKQLSCLTVSRPVLSLFQPCCLSVIRRPRRRPSNAEACKDIGSITYHQPSTNSN